MFLKIITQKKKLYLITSLLLVAILLSGCVKLTSKKEPVVAGILGMHKTVDGGVTWAGKNALLNAEGVALAFNDATINKIVIDPHDENYLFLITNIGLFYSMTQGDGWLKVSNLGPAQVYDVAIDYFDKCNVYVATGQSIYQSTDCLRTWQEIYFDKRSGIKIYEVEIENYKDNRIYAANSQGDLLKSIDHGKTWKKIRGFGNQIKQILIHKDDTRIIYIGTGTKGIFKTTDAGETWSDENPETDINKKLKEFSGSKNYTLLTQDMTQKDTFLLLSRYGILKTENGGMDWEPIELITPEGGKNIYSLAVDPKNTNNIFYGTNTTLYKTIDGGETWQTEKSPTPGWINYLIFDPKDSKKIYLGAKALPKK